MSENRSELLEFSPDDTLAGFRLQRLEVFNWGTFNGRVWTLNLNGKNCLLTGDIGSGKSTLVDAVTALMVPSHRVAFNKAAGADSKERTLRSYVLGYYKSERHAVSGGAKPVALRDHNAYSVILGVFHNEGFQLTVTLAQVFWHKDTQGQPERFYIVCEADMAIATNFTQFGGDIPKLRKQLRTCGAEIFDSFPKYGAWFRRRFGIQNEQALELFHQTVSMKSVGNLTDFVRGHMLEPFDVDSRIKALISHFDDLNRAHKAVLKAKRQVSLLLPLIEDCDTHANLSLNVETLRSCRNVLRPYFSKIKIELLNKRLEKLTGDAANLKTRIDQLEETIQNFKKKEWDLKQSIAQNGGGRIEVITNEIKDCTIEQQRRAQKAQRYADLVKDVNLKEASDHDTFLAQRSGLAHLNSEALDQEANIQNEITVLEVDFAQDRKEHDRIKTEIDSLRSRRSNIDARQIAIRSNICTALHCSEDEFPFAGELIQIRPEEKDWEGAIERLLHNFGLSMLVTEKYYSQVVAWVEKTHLSGRLVYFRVRDKEHNDRPNRHARSVANKVDIKPDSHFLNWLEFEMANRFDVVCCSTHEDFQRESRAITKSGQIKGRDQRHEKDDRHRIDDRSRYVLGWSNEAKIAALEEKIQLLEIRLARTGARIAALQKENRQLRTQLETLSKLVEYQDFREIDWQSLVKKIALLNEEKARIEKASDILQTLATELRECEMQKSANETLLISQRDSSSKIEQRIADTEEQRMQTQAVIADADSVDVAKFTQQLDALHQQSLGEYNPTIESCDNKEQTVRQFIQTKIDAEEKKLTRLREKIVDAMGKFRNFFENETREMDASVEAASEYRKLLIRLQLDDLPRFEACFKQLLNENTIREIANFHSQLIRERVSIQDRIDQINESLTQIDYNTGRYIQLMAEHTQDADIRNFQGELRQCTEGELTGSSDVQYSELKFLQVRQIIDRFRGREGQSDMDRRWTSKVTDVRNWFVFSASERWRIDDTEHEHYSDSGGKSGGQKEKLAYTILAASLAYQFGLQWGEVRSRTFRFVVIDEAFGRGSDESAQYALELFKRLNLQLLIITPLQKIHIIEPYVSSVGFVQNADGSTSKLRNLTIEEYQREKLGDSM